MHAASAASIAGAILHEELKKFLATEPAGLFPRRSWLVSHLLLRYLVDVVADVVP